MEVDDIKILLPPFNPNSSLSLNSQEWVDEVENMSALQNWSDEHTLLYASLRLEDDAKLWFCTNKWNNWKQFKSKLVSQFPTSKHLSQYLEKLLKRHKEDGESFDDYVNDVVQLAGKCNFTLPTAIHYIISGLSDANMRNRLIAYNCTSIQEVLSRIQTITFNQEQEAKWTNSEEPKPTLPPKKPPPPPTAAPAPADVEFHPNYPTLKNEAEWSDLVVTVKVADVLLTAFVDLSSKYTTLQSSEFRKHSWKLRQHDVKALGFRLGLSKVLGKTIKTVIAGQVEMLIEILVVEDNFQSYPIILGRNFLHNKNVCIVKSFQSCEINFVDTPKSTTPIPTPQSTAPPKNKKKKRSRNKSNNQQQMVNNSSSLEIQKIIEDGKTYIKEILVRVREENGQIKNYL
ncbi:uncharacterized protein LOC129951972 [Eupeodes corollae]|uniref:uncharacterized protein LOC129951972 n=1 Tax=Eupeodes corollae TaxID=290404 RepID=UPI0024930783|nr:uncharacterized protein LOC129951972 [Eupeodes corollae]